jgi:hypothetical protein
MVRTAGGGFIEFNGKRVHAAAQSTVCCAFASHKHIQITNGLHVAGEDGE